MEPIINPWLFYLIAVVDDAQWFLNIIIFLSIASFIVISTYYFIEFCSDDYRKEHKENALKNSKSILKKIFKTFIACSVAISIIPGSDTIYKMIVADNITPNNLEIVSDTVEGGIDYIFEKINSLTLDEMEDAEND